MTEITDGKIVPIDVETEMKRSYLLYSMSVIVGRALPDVRDGLKPIHRRILYAMGELGLTSQKPHRKSATVVGEVMGKYHPHGDAAIYDTIVRMAQDFSLRYPLVDGHGNFGSVDGDPPAAQRYTEVRMTSLASEMLRDIDKETVDFQPNFDESLKEPKVLPARFPNLLVNGSSGIAVGMATNIPPHNLSEVIDGVVALIDNPDISVKELMKHIKGPDFPTGGLILGRDGITEAYKTGKGTIKVRARASIETAQSGKSRIIVTEIPYQVNKAKLVEKIAELVRNKVIDGITDLRDESDRNGMRIVIELRRDVNPRIVLNQLYKHTQMQDTFGVIMLVLVGTETKILNLKEVLQYYVKHQEEVVVRRTRFDLARAEERAHILEGLRIALDNLDAVIKLIRESKDPETAKIGLMTNFGLSDRQAQAILDMRLQRLTNLERRKIEEEYQEVVALIKRLKDILANPRLVLEIIKEELLAIKEKYGDERRTEITAGAAEFEVEDLIAKEDIVVTLTHQGYIKRLPVTTYRAQRRGGKGITGINTREEDFVETIFITTTHDHILFFSDKGKVYSVKAYDIPEAQRQARGTPIINLISVDPGELITAVIPVGEFDEDSYLFMATKKGIVKKTPLLDFVNVRRSGITALNLDEDDALIGVRLTKGDQEVLMVTREGMAIRFPEEDVRPMGRAARGVKGISLDEGDAVVAMDTVKTGAGLLTVTALGYGKRTPVGEYRIQSRGGRGLKTMHVTEKNGPIVGARVVHPEDEVMIITSEGIVIRLEVGGISELGRNTQGVKLMSLEKNDQIVALATVASKNGNM